MMRYGLLLPGLLLVELSGCSRTRPPGELDLHEALHPVEIQPLDLRTDPLTAGMQHPLNYNPPVASLPSVAPQDEVSQDAKETATGAHYYVDFCDIYWKLNWMRRELLKGTVPYNMQDEIDKMFKKLRNLRRDGNYTVTYEALSRMQKGLEHLACLRTLHAARINDLEVPWEAGAMAVEQYFDRNHTAAVEPATPALSLHAHGSGDDDDDERDTKSSLPPPTEVAPDSARSQAISMVMDYVSRYRTSPRTMMQREWEAAIRKTNKLRDNLALQNRKENDDGDDANVDLAVSIGAGDYGTIHVPEGAGQGSVAPAEVEDPQM